MYRTPSQHREYPAHAKSTVSGAHSTYGSFRSVRPGQAPGGARDQVIHILKRELAELKSGHRGLGPVAQQLSTVEHRYRLLAADKGADEERTKARETMYQSIIAHNSEDVSDLQKRIDRKLLDTRELRASFNALERSVAATETEIAILEGRLRDEVAVFERLAAEKANLEQSSAANQGEVAELRSKLALIKEDIEKMIGQLTKQARSERELKDRMAALELDTGNKRQTLYALETELRNQAGKQASKEKELRRRGQRVELLEGECGILDGERAQMDEDRLAAEEALKALCEERGDLRRRLESLRTDKSHQQQAVRELNADIDAEKKALHEEEAAALGLAAQQRSLRNTLEKLRAGVRKTAKTVVAVSERREEVHAALDRRERVRVLLEDAAVEVALALRVAME